MSFKLRPEVDEWFSRISRARTSPLSTKFDSYYICLMMGLATGRAVQAPSAIEFVGTFVNDYRPAQNIIIGMLVAAEANAQGVNLGDRIAIQRLLSLYVSPESSIGLTSDGFQRLNEYANGGFNEIASSYPEQPWIAADFLEWYLPALELAVQANRWWTQEQRLVMRNDL